MNIPHLASRGLYKRSLVVKVGPWNERLERWQDFEYNVRVSAQQVPFVETKGDFHYWRNHASGRIEDFGGTAEGVDLALTTLDAVEAFLDQVAEEVKQTTIKRPYVRVIREAMMKGSHQQVKRAISGIQNQDIPVISELKFRAAHLIYLVTGGRVTTSLLSVYPRLRSLLNRAR
jgi:hypothetical protein